MSFSKESSAITSSSSSSASSSFLISSSLSSSINNNSTYDCSCYNQSSYYVHLSATRTKMSKRTQRTTTSMSLPCTLTVFLVVTLYLMTVIPGSVSSLRSESAFVISHQPPTLHFSFYSPETNQHLSQKSVQLRHSSNRNNNRNSKNNKKLTQSVQLMKRTTRATALSLMFSPFSTTFMPQLLLSPIALNLIAGSIAGAVGVGVAYPLDTIKTKQQVLRSSITTDRSSGDSPRTNNHPLSCTSSSKMNIFTLIQTIYEQDGLRGFYSGVQTTMMGQAVIKAVAFTMNAVTYQFLLQHVEQPQQHILVDTTSTLSTGGGGDVEMVCLLAAACFSGLVTSFLVVPIERIKVMMQSQQKPPPTTFNIGSITSTPPELAVAVRNPKNANNNHFHHPKNDDYIYNTSDGIDFGLGDIGTVRTIGGYTPTAVVALSLKPATTVCNSNNLNKNIHINNYYLNQAPMTTVGTETAAGISKMKKNKNHKYYRNEIECLLDVLRHDGFHGLLFRGLTPTLFREIPRYGVYFFFYKILMESPFLAVTAVTATASGTAGIYDGSADDAAAAAAALLSVLGPLLSGAIAGCLSWLPVYPTDIVKTVIQNTPGKKNSLTTTRTMTSTSSSNNSDTGTCSDDNPFKVGMDLYNSAGGSFQVFYEGLSPKLLRAAVINAVTFFTYDTTVHFLTETTNVITTTTV